MQGKVPIEEVRILRKILEGIDMIFHSDTVSVDPDKRKPDAESVDSTQLMRELLAINKIELLINRVTYILAESPYCRICFEAQNDFELDLRLPVHALEQHFQEHELLRVHRSYLVNPSKVLCVERQGVRDYEIWIKIPPKATVQIPVGRSYVKKIRDLHPNWFRG